MTEVEILIDLEGLFSNNALSDVKFWEVYL